MVSAVSTPTSPSSASPAAGSTSAANSAASGSAATPSDSASGGFLADLLALLNQDFTGGGPVAGQGGDPQLQQLLQRLKNGAKGGDSSPPDGNSLPLSALLSLLLQSGVGATPAAGKTATTATAGISGGNSLQAALQALQASTQGAATDTTPASGKQGSAADPLAGLDLTALQKLTSLALGAEAGKADPALTKALASGQQTAADSSGSSAGDQSTAVGAQSVNTGSNDPTLQRLLASLSDSASGDSAAPAAAASSRGNAIQSAADQTVQGPQSGSVSWQLALDLASAAGGASTSGSQAGAGDGNGAPDLQRQLTLEHPVGSDSLLTSTTQPFIVAGHPAAAPAANAASAPDLALQTPVHSSEWAGALGERIVWMTDQNLSNAQIRLNPPQLGPLDVHVSVGADQTNIVLTTHSDATRDVLAAAAPRLQQILASQGLGTVNVNINHQSTGGRSPQNQGYQSWPAFDATAAAPVSAVSAAPAAAQSHLARALDAYA